MSSNQSPLVSIVMPTFNQEQFIGKAIKSVMEQSHPNWELLVVNNFSTDKTRTVVESFSDQRIKLLDFANKGVIAASRNHAITHATGTLISFLDSDDYWSADKLLKSIGKLNDGYDLVCHGEYFFKDGSEDFIPTKYGPEQFCSVESMLTKGNCLSTSAILVKKSILDRVGLFDETKEFITAEDFDLWIRIAAAGAKIGIIDDMLGFYRLHQGSASASNLKNAKATLAVLKKNIVGKKLPTWTKLKEMLFRARIGFYIMRAERC